MNVEKIYNDVKDYIKNNYGTKRWCYTDFFMDNQGFEYFKEQIETDKEITNDMDDEEITQHICNSLSSSMTIYTFQQTMLSI